MGETWEKWKGWSLFSIKWTINTVKGFTWKTWLKILLALLVLLAIVLCLLFLPWAEWLGDFLEWVEYLGIWGPILLCELYIACTILMIPGSILTLGAGFAFQSVWIAFVSVSIGSTIGCIGAFLYGNTFFRGWVENKIRPYKVFVGLDAAISEKGWVIVLLLRLSPVIPFNLLNYALGITNIGLIEYGFFSWLGMIPATIVYCYIGTTLSDIVVIVNGEYEGGPATLILFIVGLIATVVVVILITYFAKVKISKIIKEIEDKEALLDVENGSELEDNNDDGDGDGDGN